MEMEQMAGNAQEYINAEAKSEVLNVVLSVEAKGKDDNSSTSENENEDLGGFEFEADDFNKIPIEKERDNAAKKQQKQEKEERHRKAKRKQERQKKKQKSKNYKEYLATLTEEERTKYFDKKRQEEDEIDKKLEESKTSGMKIIIDLDYQSHMRQKDIKSLAAQVAMCYNLNKKIERPFSYNLCSYTGEAKAEFDIMGANYWRFNIFPEQLCDLEIIKDKSKVIYLSPDSDEVLDDFTRDNIFVIGGFVDRPVSKNRSLYKAMELEIKCKRLPLQENLDSQNFNHVLNINTVVEMLYHYLEEKNWVKVIEICLPDRMYKYG